MSDSPIAEVNALLKSGRSADAVTAARRAIYERSATGVAGGLELAELQNALGTALAQTGDAQAAERAYLQAATADGSLYKPHANLANLYMKRGQPALAAARLREAVRLEPNAGRLWARLGQALSDQGDPAGARVAFERAVQVEDNVPHRGALARLYLATGNPAQAVALLEGRELGSNVDASVAFAQALAMAGDSRAGSVAEAASSLPLNPALGHALARVAIEAGRLELALKLARDARAGSDAGDAELVILEAACLEGLGQAAAAIELIEAAFDAAPSIPWMYVLSGIAQRTGAVVRSPGAFEAARVLFPDSVDVQVAWGRYARGRRDFDGAYEAFERAVGLDPAHAGAVYGLGVAEATLAPGPRAIELLERAVRLDPTDPSPYSALLFAELHANVWSVERRLEEHRSFGRRFMQTRRLARTGPRLARAGRTVWTESSSLDGVQEGPTKGHQPAKLVGTSRKLRVGYLSADFRDHAVARFLLGLLSSHDHDRWDVFLYGSVGQSDAVTDRFKTLGTYRGIHNLSNEAAADLIAHDALDVLVSVDGHTAGSRVRLLAARPAPVQVSFLGYPATLGLDCIDVRITDAVADPEGAERGYSERLVRLPHTAWCFTRDAAPGTSREGGSGPIVFSTFNRSAKLSDAFLAAIKRILQAVPSSRLAVKTPTIDSSRFRARISARLGAEAARVDYLPWSAESKDHLASYAKVDIALDTFPYAGTTTTAEAIYMGVPVVTLAGETHVERVGASMLGAVGLDDCIARSVDAYVEIARRLAVDAERRGALRRELRGRMQASPLGDPDIFARSFEACLEGLVTDEGERARPPGTRVVRTDIGARLVVPDSLDTVTTWVIDEQMRWFEDEVAFVRGLLREGDAVVDVGANLGVYAIEAARIVGPRGRVVAFEPSSSTAAMLRASIAHNDLANVKLHQTALGGRDGEATLLVGSSPELSELGTGPGPSEVVAIRTLGAFAADVAGATFLKLDAEGAEQEILEASGDLVRKLAPVVMFELKHKAQVNLGLLGTFRSLGFGLYRLCPGASLLVSIGQHEALDGFCLNLFAVPPVRVAELEARGLLAEQSSTAATPEGPEAIAAWARTRPLLSSLGLDRPQPTPPAGLGYWLSSRRADLSPAARWGALIAAEREVLAAVEHASTPAVGLTAARIQLDLGKRSRAIETVRRILGGPARETPTQAFACPLAEYEELDRFDPERVYAAQVHEVDVRLSAFSTFYQPPNVLEKLRAFYRAGGVSAAMDRRLGLCLARADDLRR